MLLWVRVLVVLLAGSVGLVVLLVGRVVLAVLVVEVLAALVE